MVKIKPNIINNYDGKDIIINEKLKMILSSKDYPCLLNKIGHTLIHTDGTTLLGADDKAGITIIMGVVESLLKANFDYPNLIITFTPDEEIGMGTKHFNYTYYFEKNCHFAYTIDGGLINEINFENFNAASCKVKINGTSIHPGSAKGKMINSQLIAMEFQAMLPKNMVPELTEGYEGFFHLSHMRGSVEQTILEYIVRNHNKDQFMTQKNLLMSIANFLNQKYGENTIQIFLTDSYYNMRDIILSHYEILEYAIKGLKRQNIEPTFVPIRGGTDGASLSYNGLYTPNLGTGGENFHGPYEFLDVTDMEKMISTIIEILKVMMEK